jgi:hypothetical protein
MCAISESENDASFALNGAKASRSCATMPLFVITPNQYINRQMLLMAAYDIA